MELFYRRQVCVILNMSIKKGSATHTTPVFVHFKIQAKSNNACYKYTKIIGLTQAENCVILSLLNFRNY